MLRHLKNLKGVLPFKNEDGESLFRVDGKFIDKVIIVRTDKPEKEDFKVPPELFLSDDKDVWFQVINGDTFKSVITSPKFELSIFSEEESKETKENNEEGEEDFAKWDRKYINDLPDAAFAVILPGGEKDEEGKTVPRSLRKLPHHNENVKTGKEHDTVDLPHLRNALARAPQMKVEQKYIDAAIKHLNAHAKALGIGEAGEETKKKEKDSEEYQNEYKFPGDITKPLRIDAEYVDYVVFEPVSAPEGEEETKVDNQEEGSPDEGAKTVKTIKTKIKIGSDIFKYMIIVPKGFSEEYSMPKYKFPYPVMKAKYKDVKFGLDTIDTVKIGPVEIFAVGTWKGKTFTEDDLIEMKENFYKLKNELSPPLKLGHNEEQILLKQSGFIMDGKPAAGWVTDLEVEDGKLLAYFDYVPETIKKIIDNKGYRFVSSEIFSEYVDIGGNKHKNVLKAVSLLGEELPACKSLKEVAALYGTSTEMARETLVPNKFSEENFATLDVYSFGALGAKIKLEELKGGWDRNIFWLFMEQIEKILDDDEFDDVAKKEQIRKLKDEFKTEVDRMVEDIVATFSEGGVNKEPIIQFSDIFIKLADKYSELKLEYKNVSEKYKTLVRQNFEKDVDNTIEDLVKQGKLPPAGRKKLKSLMFSLQNVKCFVDESKSAIDLLKEVLDVIPKNSVVNFNETGKTNKDEFLSEDAKIEKYAKDIAVRIRKAIEEEKKKNKV